MNHCLCLKLPHSKTDNLSEYVARRTVGLVEMVDTPSSFPLMASNPCINPSAKCTPMNHRAITHPPSIQRFCRPTFRHAFTWIAQDPITKALDPVNNT